MVFRLPLLIDPYFAYYVMSKALDAHYYTLTTMDIQHKDGKSKGSFFIEEEGKVIAELTYSKAGDTKIIIDHHYEYENIHK